MNILGLDCAGGGCGVAVLTGDETAAQLWEPMRHGQAERAVPMIAEVLALAGLTPAQLDAVAVTVGPGAFTGVRVGLSAALGLARAIGAPCAGVTVTEVLAAAAPLPDTREARLIAALDSRRPDAPFLEVFTAAAVGRSGAGLVWRGDGPMAGDPDTVAALVRRLTEGSSGVETLSDHLLLCGDAAPWLAAQLAERGVEGRITAGLDHADPAIVARVGAMALRAGTERPAQPLYLRAPDVSAPAADRARRPTEIGR